MKRKGKKGSSLVMVVFVTAIIFTVGTVMLALVQTDYKARIQRSESIKNLYGADSGLNLVNNSIRKEAEAAMFCAANQVKQDFQDKSYDLLDKDAVLDKEKYNDINGCFQYYFITALTSSEISADANDFKDTTGITFSNDAEPLCFAASNLKYNDYSGVTDKTIYKVSALNQKSIYDNTNNNEGKDAEIKVLGINVQRANVDPKNLADLKSNVGYKKNLEQKLKVIQDYVKDQNNVNSITIKVQSTFYTTDKKGYKSPKVITTKFVVNAPDYDEMLTASVDTVKLIDYPFLRAITCDGSIIYNPTDFKKDNGYDATVNGGVWCKGSLEDKDYASKKYDNGIIVRGGKLKVQGLADKAKEDPKSIPSDTDKNDTENYKGLVFSNGSISLIGNCNVTLPTVYTRNIYSGKNTNYSKKTDGSNIDLLVNGNVSTNNDLVINSSKTNYTIDGSYYGINDVIGTNDDNASKKDLTMRASSIIVNKDENNKINIDGDAYINGVAILDIDHDNDKKMVPYVTGESVAVQGNYKAYTEVMPNEGDVSLQYYDAYTLIGGSVADKANHFIKYYSNGTKASNGGVQVGKSIYALGASVKADGSGTKVGGKNLLDSAALEVIKQSKLDYARRVLLMNYNPVNLGDDHYMGIYNKYDTSLSVLGDTKTDCKPVVDFEKYEKYLQKQVDDNKITKDEMDKMKVLVTGDDDAKIFKSKYYKTLYDCKDEVITVKHNGVYVGTDKVISALEATGSNNGEKLKINAVIITKGNVIFDSSDGPIDYHGTVVAGKDVQMKGDKNIEITFDKKQVQYAMVEQQSVYPALKESYFIEGIEDGVGQVGTKLSTEDDYQPSYDTKYIKEGLWKLGANNVKK